jgi:Response regulator containing a CheY-like receiver domain and an HTH DNA-binding domain
LLVRNAQLQVVSTQPLIARLLEDALHARLPEFPAASLVLDWPVGFAFQVVTPESAASSFVLTQNACPEYLDDLWNLGLLGLAYRSRTLEELAELLRRAETQERVRLTPAQRSPLTPAEGDLLRLVARGLANKEIARELGIANQTVQNGLTRVFQKLGCDGRSEAILHYWGLTAATKEPL